MKQKKRIIYVAIIVIVLLVLAWRLNIESDVVLVTAQDSRLSMDTLITVTLVAPENSIRSTFVAGFDEIDRVAKMTDRFNNNTDLAELNQKKSLSVKKELVDIIALGEEFRKKSSNAFDIRIAKLADLWGFGTKEQKVPSMEAVNQNMPQGDVAISGSQVSIPENVSLDLGALAKGYAIERARNIMKKSAPAGLILGGGSSVAAWGEHPEGRPWRIGIKHPRDSSKFLGVIELEDGWSLGTSGDYERFFIEESKRYHHIIDGRTGFPKEGVMACSILIKDATLSDILSTLLFVLGPEEGKLFLEKEDLGPLAVFWVLTSNEIVTYEKDVSLPKLTY